MKILVTGGAGFIGSQIVDEYVRLGHQVSILDNLSTGRKRNINPAAKFCEADIRDAARVKEVFEQEKFDVMNHHAAQMDVRRSVEDPVFDASVNVLGVLTLLEQCMKTGVKRIVFASSGGAIYGEQDYFPADELHPTRPISPYGVAKLTTEHYLFYYKAVYGIDSESAVRKHLWSAAESRRRSRCRGNLHNKTPERAAAGYQRRWKANA